MKFFNPTESSICGAIYFDKTKNLNNYNLKAVLNNDSFLFHWKKMKTGYDSFDGIAFNIMCSMLDHIHATITIKFNEYYGYVDELGEAHGQIEDVTSGDVDIAIALFPLNSYWRVQGYPVFPDSLEMISSKESVADETRFSRIFDLRFWFFGVVSCFSCIIALKFILDESMPSTVLDFLRIFVSASSLNQPENSPLRVLFITYIISVFAFSSFIQSRLSALESVPLHIPTINSVEDLVRLNFTIYGYMMANNDIMLDEDFVGRYRFSRIPAGDCLNLLREDDNHVACLEYGSALKYKFGENATFHVSTFLSEMGLTFLYAEDIPLLSKFNWIFLRMNEGGFIKLFSDREERYYFHDEIDTVESIDMDKLVAGFDILCWGWLSAVVVCLLELSISKIKKCWIKLLRRVNAYVEEIC